MAIERALVSGSMAMLVMKAEGRNSLSIAAQPGRERTPDSI